MNQIKPHKWTSEWYDLATTDELMEMLRETKELLERSAGKAHAKTRHEWQERLRRIEQELSERSTSEEEWGLE